MSLNWILLLTSLHLSSHVSLRIQSSPQISLRSHLPRHYIIIASWLLLSIILRGYPLCLADYIINSLSWTTLNSILDLNNWFSLRLETSPFQSCSLSKVVSFPFVQSIQGHVNPLFHSHSPVKVMLWKIKPASIRKHEIPALPAHIWSHDCLHN
jgi:hypothetical protein